MTNLEPVKQAEMKLRAIALGFPGTSEHFPWGHRTIKVNGKAFVFMGIDDDKRFFFSAKLPTSHHMALMFPFAAPTGYGLGKSGWVSAGFDPGVVPPVDLLGEWLDESYRAIAPVKLVKLMGAPGGDAAAATAPTAKKIAGRQAPARKTAAKKPAAKKLAAKKPAANKPAAKKSVKPTAAKKPAAKKTTAAKKPTANKPTPKPATRTAAKKPTAKKPRAR
jgi:hypothetical protein